MPLRAIFYVLLAMFLLALQDAIFKKLIETHAVLELLFLRMSLVVLILFIVFLARRDIPTLQTRHWPLMCLRGTAAFGAFTLYYLALQKIPLAEGATVLMSAPLFVTALSAPLLKEKIGPHRWAAVCIGFIAVLIMLRPGTALFQPVMVLPLISALLYSLIPIITRAIDSKESAFIITFYTTVSYLALCLLASIWVHLFPASTDSAQIYASFAQSWTSPSPLGASLILSTALLFCAGVFLLTLAYRLAQASAIASFEYFYLVWAILVGYMVFGDVPAVITCTAAAIIASCGIYIAWRERRQKTPIKVGA